MQEDDTYKSLKIGSRKLYYMVQGQSSLQLHRSEELLYAVRSI